MTHGAHQVAQKLIKVTLPLFSAEWYVPPLRRLPVKGSAGLRWPTGISEPVFWASTKRKESLPLWSTAFVPAHPASTTTAASAAARRRNADIAYQCAAATHPRQYRA